MSLNEFPLLIFAEGTQSHPAAEVVTYKRVINVSSIRSEDWLCIVEQLTVHCLFVCVTSRQTSTWVFTLSHQRVLI